eukprot:SAG31_NODE_565_length_14056_cov_22.573189_5_plen_763_part_00
MSADDRDQQELSLTVKDTNALREKLGLKPLRLTNDKDDAIRQRQKEQADADRKLQNEIDIESRIDQMRNARLLKQEIDGPTLAQKLAAQGHVAAAASMADWVSHSRIVEKERQLATKRAAELDALDDAAAYTEKDLSGLTVEHDANDIGEGETVIMTLKDSTILREEDGDVEMNEDADALENVNMAENDRTKERLELKKKKAFARYSDALADGDESGALGGGAVLPHYDEVIDGQTKSSKQQFTLGEEGAEEDAKRKKLEEIRAKLAKGDVAAAEVGKKRVVSVDEPMQRNVGTDYYTQAEMTQFKKPKEKKRRKVRKKKKGLLDELVPVDGGNNDRGSRGDAAKAKRDADAATKAVELKKYGYENAMAKATEQSKHLVDDVEFDLGINEDDDPELQKSLARVKNLTAKNPGDVAETLKARINVIEKTVPAGGDDGGDLMIVYSNNDGGSLTFTETGEFCKGISTEHLKKRRKVETMDSEDEDAGADDEDEEPESAWTTSTMEVLVKDETEEQPTEECDDVDGGIEAEPVVARGLAATLDLARSKGMLQELDARHGRTNDMKTQIIQERQLKKKAEFEVKKKADLHQKSPSASAGGRADNERRDRDRRDRERERDRRERRSRSRSRDRDTATGTVEPAQLQRPRQGDLKDVDRIDAMMRNRDQVDIKYHDAYGRKLSSKEAFRQLCHQFHGIVPGKAKTEKDLRKMEEEKKLSLMGLTDTPLNAMQALSAEQQKAGKAFINLDAKKVSEKEMKKLQKKRKQR